MASNDREFTVEKIKEAYRFIQNSNYYKIYDEFGWKCKNHIYWDNGVSCYKVISNGLSGSYEVTELLKDLYSNLYRVYFTKEKRGNDYFDNNEDEVRKMGCIYLKYWLYDKITSKGFSESKITEVFQGINNHIKGQIHSFTKDYCNFNVLTLNYIKNIRKIYALNMFLNTFDINFNNCNSNSCKYMEYFGEGLDEFISSINKCSSEESTGNYCKEFKEFLDLCRDVKEYAGFSIYEENTKSEAEREGKYFLSFEKYKNEPLYIYIKNKEVLNFVKNSHFLNSQYRTTIAATSIVGSAIGLSSILYYFYKFTPFGSAFLRGNGKNIVNMGEEAHNSLLYTSNTEQSPFKNREYKVAYHTFSDT